MANVRFREAADPLEQINACDQVGPCRRVVGRRGGQQIGSQVNAPDEPLADPAAIRSAVSWVLAQDGVTGFASPGDVRLLPAGVER